MFPSFKGITEIQSRKESLTSPLGRLYTLNVATGSVCLLLVHDTYTNKTSKHK